MRVVLWLFMSLSLAVGFTGMVRADDGVVKCVVAGKVTYSNKGCGVGNIGKPVEISHAAGLVSPDRRTIDSTVARAFRERDEENRRIGSVAPSSPALVSSSTQQCKDLRERNNQIDSQARSGVYSPWLGQLRQEKYDNDKRMFALKCGQAY